MAEQQKRLFVGLGFSDQFAKSLAPWTKKIRKTADQKEITLKWTPPENLHITLVFLGNTAESEIPGLCEKIQSIADRFSPFQLKIRGIGGFPTLRQARVIYMGVQRSQAILDLQTELERALVAPSEFETDYTPHLTLARLRNPKSCRDLLSPFEKMDLGQQSVTEVILFSSVLAGAFPVYEKLYRARLNTELTLEAGPEQID